MADNIQSEAVNSAGVVFATDENASSVHYPIGKIAHGALNTFNLTSTSAPFPVQVFTSGLSSSAPFYFTTDSGAPPTVAVSGYVAPSTTVTLTGYVAPSTTVTVTGYSTVVSVTGYVAPSTTVTVTGYSTVVTQTGYVAPSTTVTVTNIAGNDTTVTVSGTVTVEPTSSAIVGLTGKSALGGIVSQTFELGSSLAQTVMTAVGRLHGLSLSNPSTATNVYVKVFSDDSAGVTLGTTVPKRNLMVPFGGGREAQWAIGVDMDSGMSIVATDAAGDTAAVTAPSATIYATVDYAPST